MIANLLYNDENICDKGNVMLAIKVITTTIPVTDLKRARQFYEGILGFVPVDLVRRFGVVTYRLDNGIMLDIYERSTATSGEHTVANFYVNDVVAAVDFLETMGITPVTFPTDDTSISFDERGIVLEDGRPRVFFIKDPDGNWLSFTAYETISDMINPHL